MTPEHEEDLRALYTLADRVWASWMQADGRPEQCAGDAYCLDTLLLAGKIRRDTRKRLGLSKTPGPIPNDTADHG
jgi:hypothetical protein